MNRVLPFPLLSAALFAAWLALAGEPGIAQLVLGAVLALVIPRAAAAFLGPLPRVAAPLTAARFVLVVAWDIVIANAAVARRVLGPADRLRPAFVTVPLALTHPHSIALLASVVTMTPGTVSAVLSRDRGRLLVHALDCADPDALVVHIRQRYERPLLEIFGC